MRKYELTILLDAKATAAKKKALQEKIEKIISVFKGKAGKVEDWGAKESGNYLHFPLELDSLSVKAVSTKLKMEGEILKYLLIKKDN